MVCYSFKDIEITRIERQSLKHICFEKKNYYIYTLRLKVTNYSQQKTVKISFNGFLF